MHVDYTGIKFSPLLDFICIIRLNINMSKKVGDEFHMKHLNWNCPRCRNWGGISGPGLSDHMFDKCPVCGYPLRVTGVNPGCIVALALFVLVLIGFAYLFFFKAQS